MVKAAASLFAVQDALATALTVLALLVTVGGLTITAFVTAKSLRTKTDETYTDELEQRLRLAESDLTKERDARQALERKYEAQQERLNECAEGRERLQYSNLRLYERIDELERDMSRLRKNGGSHG